VALTGVQAELWTLLQQHAIQAT